MFSSQLNGAFCPLQAIVEDADQAIDKATPRAYGKADVFQ